MYRWKACLLWVSSMRVGGRGKTGPDRHRQLLQCLCLKCELGSSLCLTADSSAQPATQVPRPFLIRVFISSFNPEQRIVSILLLVASFTTSNGGEAFWARSLRNNPGMALNASRFRRIRARKRCCIGRQSAATDFSRMTIWIELTSS